MFSQGALDDLRDEIVTSQWFDDLCSIEPQCFSMAQYVGGSLSKVHLRPAPRALTPGGNPCVARARAVGDFERGCNGAAAGDWHGGAAGEGGGGGE